MQNKKLKKLLKKNLEYESILYNSTELLVDWTSREFLNQTILFSRKIKFLMRHNPEVIVSISYIFLAKQQTSKRIYSLKSIPEVEDSLFYFLYHHSVYDQLLPYLK